MLPFALPAAAHRRSYLGRYVNVNNVSRYSTCASSLLHWSKLVEAERFLAIGGMS